MLRIAGPLILLACLVHANHGHAQDKPDEARTVPDASLCKPICVSAREDCRAQVQQATENDTDPVLSMNPSSNPYLRASRDAGPQTQQLRPTLAQALRDRRAERLQACEVRYRSCTRACR